MKLRSGRYRGWVGCSSAASAGGQPGDVRGSRPRCGPQRGYTCDTPKRSEVAHANVSAATPFEPLSWWRCRVSGTCSSVLMLWAASLSFFDRNTLAKGRWSFWSRNCDPSLSFMVPKISGRNACRLHSFCSRSPTPPHANVSELFHGNEMPAAFPGRGWLEFLSVPFGSR
jgi:hypothetical protein